MAKITEDYCSYEVAKLLKEKGFNEPCRMYWNVDLDKVEKTISDYNSYLHDRTNGELELVNGMYNKNRYSCPTQQMAIRWLREIHSLHISLEPCYDYNSMHVVFLAFVQNIADVHAFMDGQKNVASHPNAEKSYELAIKYCLENLI